MTPWDWGYWRHSQRIHNPDWACWQGRALCGLLWQKGCLARPRDRKALNSADDSGKDCFDSLDLCQGRVATERETDEGIGSFFFHVHGAQDVGWFERSRRAGGATGSTNTLQIQTGQQRNTVTPAHCKCDCIAEALRKRPAETSAAAIQTVQK